MEANAERRAVEAQRQAVVDKAVENMTIDLPPVMIDTRVTQMINELAAQLQTQGMNLQQYMAFSGLDMDKMREDYREPAKKNLLHDIMLEQVAQKEKLTVTDAELKFEIEVMAQMYRTPPKQIEKYLKENGQIANVATTILRRKALKFIVDNMASTSPEEKPAESAPVENIKEVNPPEQQDVVTPPEEFTKVAPAEEDVKEEDNKEEDNKEV